MSESVKILIEAENQASAVIASTAKDIDAKVKAIKTSGEQAKKSTEFFGTIANALGGSELGAFAGQLSQLTEKTSQFAEVQKLGGAGALAFKAGLVAAVGVMAFQVGKALGDLIFDTKRWTEELDKATKKGEEFKAKLLELKDFEFGRAKEGISLIRDPDEQMAATKQLLAKIENEIADKRKSINEALLQKENRNVDNSIWSEEWADTNKVPELELDKQIADGEEFVKTLSAQVLELQRATDATAVANKAKKEENALKDKSDSYLGTLRNELALLESIDVAKIKAKQGGVFGDEATTEAEGLLKSIEAIKDAKAKTDKSDSFLEGLRNEVALLKAKKDEVFAIEAGQKTFGVDAGNEAAQLLKEKETLIAKRDAEKKAEDDKIAKAKQVEDIRKKEIDRLEEERIMLEKGKEAAHAFNLEKQGLSKEDAKKIAGEQAAVDKIKDSKKADAKDTPTLQASESRLLTRGGGDDPAKMTEKNTADAVKELQQMRKEMLAQSKNNTTLKVIGGKA